MIDFLKSLLPYKPWDAMDYFMMAVMGVIILFIGFLVFMLLAWIARMIFYEFSYDRIKEYKGEVVEMEYTPPRTTSTYNAATKSMQTTHHPEKNVVIFKTELKTTEVDSDKLYQRVRIGESVLVKSQARYIRPRYWSGQWEYDGEMLVSVTSEKNQTVLFNDEEPVTYSKRGY